MATRYWVVLPLVAALLTGCERNSYKLTLKPAGDSLERSLSWSVRGSPAATEPTVLVRGATPADIGGAGSFTTFESSLGDLRVYVERFRGNDDLLGQWESQAAAIDVLVDLCVAWIYANLKGEKGADELRGWADGDFRRDMKNCALYAGRTVDQLGKGASINVTTPDKAAREERYVWELTARVLLYLSERGYLKVEDVPRLARALSSDGETHFGREMGRIIIKRMHRERADIPAAIMALADDKAWAASFSQVAESGTGSDLLRRWQAKRGAGDLEDGDVLQQAAMAAIPWVSFKDFDRVRVDLKLPEQPVAFNGEWNGEGKVVSWESGIAVPPDRGVGLPLVASCAWAEPNQKEQEARFGSIVLTGKPLAEYCIWRSGLTEAEAAQWEEFVGRLTPAAGAAARIDAFRFRGAKADAPTPSGAAAIVTALKASR